MTTSLVLVALFACSGETTSHDAPPPPVTPPPVTPPPPAKVDLATMSEADRHAWLMKKGQEVYETGGGGGVACLTCHQADGKGIVDAFPPLAGQKDLMGTCVVHAGIVIHGLSGEMTVDGKKYNGAMPAQAGLSDEEIAAVISYERNSFGNSYGHCLPADVAAARALPAPVLGAAPAGDAPSATGGATRPTDDGAKTRPTDDGGKTRPTDDGTKTRPH